MIEHTDLLTHVANLTTRNGYICIVPGIQVDEQVKTQFAAQVQTHEERLGRVYNFLIDRTLDGIDFGTFDLVRDYFLGLATEHTPSEEIWLHLAEQLGHIDLLALKMGAMNGRFLALVNGDKLTPASLSNIAQAINHVGESIQELQGVWKLKVAGAKLGEGIALTVRGTVIFSFSNPQQFGQLQSSLTQLQLGSTMLENIGNVIKASTLNTLLFGLKGSIFVSKLFCREYEPTIEIASAWRLPALNITAGQRMEYGFALDELLPS